MSGTAWVCVGEIEPGLHVAVEWVRGTPKPHARIVEVHIAQFMYALAEDKRVGRTALIDGLETLHIKAPVCHGAPPTEYRFAVIDPAADVIHDSWREVMPVH